MSSEVPTIAQVKNQWLFEQIDVEFPTKESIAGRNVYQQALEKNRYRSLQPVQSTTYNLNDLFVVDFHRLTIMFSLLQSKRWELQSEQELIVEFLTQIIYSQPCDLVLGFNNGEPVAAAIVTRYENDVLISDVVVTQEQQDDRKSFIDGLMVKFSDDVKSANAVYLEEY